MKLFASKLGVPVELFTVPVLSNPGSMRQRSIGGMS